MVNFLKHQIERRLTAILAADVVGYSRLMGTDEAGTLAALKNLRTDLIDKKIADDQYRSLGRDSDTKAAARKTVEAVSFLRYAL
jgi:class 3 adenylate cyclase